MVVKGGRLKVDWLYNDKAVFNRNRTHFYLTVPLFRTSATYKFLLQNQICYRSILILA